MDGTVLVADDDRTIRTVLTQALTRAGCKVHATSSLTTLMRWVSEGLGDVIITDVVMPDGNGLEMLPKIAKDRPDLPVIVISAQNTIMTTIRATQAEAFDYLPKPFDLPDLMARTARALQTKTNSPDTSQRRTDAVEELPLIGQTSVMQALYRLIARFTNTDLPVLICGESGTGKSLIARTIHDFSDRRTLPFITATSGDFTDMESIAKILARARGGTILLDEISDFDEGSQALVVRMMDGTGDPAPRFLATCQKDLSTGSDQKSIRADLYYRLNGASLIVPPVCERVDDISPLTQHFLARNDQPGATSVAFLPEANAFFRAYPWPGNVRQLENTVRRLVLTRQTDQITADEVGAVLGKTPDAKPETGESSTEKLSESVARHLQRYFELHGHILPPAGVYGRILREIEKPLLEIAMDATGGNQAKCADLLGINRNTLRKKLTELDIQVTRRRKLM